jgi:antitoxin (DNA-binding transcriptional repressor) of toxin-antitoxin stability system
MRFLKSEGQAMSTISLEEATVKLSELTHTLKPGEEVVITENDQPVAKLVRQDSPGRRPTAPTWGRQGKIDDSCGR